jgi:hypothetical protein
MRTCMCEMCMSSGVSSAVDGQDTALTCLLACNEPLCNAQNPFPP